MKELTEKEKAQRYDEALGRAKEIHTEERAQPFDVMLKVFPELKESEDEVTRKEILDYIIKGSESLYDVQQYGKERLEKWIAWLEKQGERKLYVSDNAKEMFIKALERVEEQNNKGYKLTDCDKNSWWEDFKTYASCTVEQNPADKDESKFHEGDWVVYNNDICQIVKREEGCNKLVTVFGIEKKLVNERNLSTARLWTIQDAKDGDVLCSEQIILLFKKWEYNNDWNFVIAYAGIDITGKLQITNEHWLISNHAHPATKEGRDLLFAKMKEAGYEWDSDKKELKKIEQKPAENSAKVSESSTEEKDMGEYKKGFECGKQRVLKYPEDFGLCKKSTWSEERFNSIIESYKDLLKDYKACHDVDYIPYNSDTVIRNVVDDVNFLKSLKDRYTWKPSDEQMGVIEAVINNRSFQRRHLDSLYEQLKKLREE